ncbi:MAG: ATP-binding protein [Pirellulaceae bacterium]
MFACHHAIPISDTSQIGEARRHAVRLAEEINLSEAQCGEVAIVVTELATNLSRYATGGEVLLRPLTDLNGGLEIISIDRGPGMADVARCLQDGYSTGGTPGNGLGAVHRLSSEFDLYSCPSGTVVFARLLRKSAGPSTGRGFPWGAISRPAPRELVCGDVWRIAQRAEELSVMIADGLGHGPLAAQAAYEAAGAFDHDPFAPLSAIVATVDARMRGTRGGALGIARFDAQAQALKYTGVGNIAASLRSNGESASRGLVSHYGTVGVQVRRVQEFEYPCGHGSLLIMHSDGLQSRWSLDPYPGLAHRHPALIAATLYRDFSRGRDDVTVAAIRFDAAHVVRR